MRGHTSVVVCLGIAACSSNESVETVYDPCSALTLALAPDVGAAERAGVEGAIAAWSAVLPTELAIGSGARAADVLPIQFEPGDTFYRAIYWDAHGTIAVGRDRLAPEDYALAIAHELGHAFGLLHVDDRPSVMNVGNLELAPNAEDAAAVRALWASCQ